MGKDPNFRWDRVLSSEKQFKFLRGHMIISRAAGHLSLGKVFEQIDETDFDQDVKQRVKEAFQKDDEDG